MKRINSIISTIIYCAIIFFSVAHSYAQSKNPNKHIIKSSFNNKSYQLNVSLPKNYSATDTLHYPVLYVLMENSHTNHLIP